jgi:hypothetical protein
MSPGSIAKSKSFAVILLKPQMDHLPGILDVGEYSIC